MLATVIALLAAGVAAAAQPGASQLTPPTASAPKPEDKVVCKTIESTASRIDSRRVCRTRAEWDASARRARDDWNRNEINGYSSGTVMGNFGVPGEGK